uniref:ATP synthase subunit 9, mitochondrial n=1 Tax=Laetiporus sulphureus TaxID=5630 RepID=A0A2S0S3Z9_9APHY|nr:ATP synthase F0 subunit c [Laetiporus sulphureus]
MLQAAKYLGAGLACSGLIGARSQELDLSSPHLLLLQLEIHKSENNYSVTQFWGFALAEATGLFALLIAFLVLYS